MEKIHRLKTIKDFHRSRGLPDPEHPLVSVVDYGSISHHKISEQKVNWVFDFYSIGLKRISSAKVKMKYGQQEYDFDAGTMFFIAPNQVFNILVDADQSSTYTGTILLIHPDFLYGTPLSKNMRQYDFFDYATNEALFLSNKEESIMNNIFQHIQVEYHTNIDRYSQHIIISQIETLLNYSERFYNRQFITRKGNSHHLLSKLETVLDIFFTDDHLLGNGLPTVQQVSEDMSLSVNYLTRMLKVLTGKTTQQHIHDRLIEKAKEKLSTSELSVSEIAYGLGFEHSQSFSKLFKNKTNQSPLEFRHSFN
ncbi:helix-turn-helix domain-containing protein [Flagellimonas olearia]|uniref:AraC family transcriptional regulator n=1 Tax=Flagellimonas olearia TaxID=552546 RepID=A0A444VJW5_9FLAO|nr:response regulator transcription factor [Allomuricauda olearia]RYC51034.1 AraC family transcriptional regulator [Allomuricauda olearia]